MTDIDKIIKREVNPFDPIKFKTTWGEKQGSAEIVESIHKEAIIEIEKLLDLVAKDHRSRTILLAGDSGSGKTHLLVRLKLTLNPKAFFAYILCNWADSNNIWRHILRHTVDSLIQVPEGEQNSQLILWLKSLSAFTKNDVKQGIFNDNIWRLLQTDRKKFIKHLKDTYKQASIYNPDVFFGILHDLTNPELYDLACEWLRGDDLSEESMQALKVRHCINTEDAAKNILANFGRISTQTQPIVLCFDNLDTMPPLPDGFLDIQPFFNVNTTIHSDCLKNFLLIISVITSTWKRNLDRIQPADKAGIHRLIQLKYITLEQAEALWAYHLKALHQEANPQPTSPIFPLTRQSLEKNFPGGRTKPRNTLELGRNEYQKYKFSLIGTQINLPEKIITIVQTPDSRTPKIIIPPPPPDDNERIRAEFQLIWQQEYTKNQGKIGKISLLAAPDLIRMVQEALEALEVEAIKPKLISGNCASYSLSYQQPGKQETIGIVWTEDGNMNSFFHIMNACQRAIQQNICQILYLIRIAGVGNARLAGNKIYNQIFTNTKHIHIKPNLTSVHYLATYQNFVNSALSQELVVAGKTITLQKLQSLIRESEILQKCTLLQDLKIVAKQEPEKNNENSKPDLRPVKDFLLNLVKTQGFMGVPTLIKEAGSQFPSVKETDTQHLIELLCQERKVKIIDPKSKLEDQLIRLVTN
ncbi:MAG: ATP-binding protein [Desmonostoc geniculatum HA4340-LM1]|jgi:GTPase SAR1 family protein|nr:ATP-binding protein [Desmonostoc geniculatum HA4340-LM1]